MTCPTSTTAICRAPLQRLLAAQSDATNPMTLPRRSFLKLAGAGGLALGAFPHLAHGARRPRPGRQRLKPTQQPSAFVQIAANGSVTVTINRLEFGQGVQTALPMILAEELDADWCLVRSRHGNERPGLRRPAVRHAPHRRLRFDQELFTQYRELGARARAMLVGAAAAQLEGGCRHACARSTGVVLGPGGRKLGYGELAEAAMALPVPEKVTLKDPKDFRIIGKPTGAARCARQVQRPTGLRHRHAPARHADRRGGASAGVRRAGLTRWTTARREPSRA